MRTVAVTFRLSPNFPTGRAEWLKDEAGTQRISQSDALGRITEACEISSNANMPDGSGSPVSCGTDYSGTGFVTSYAYSLANHTMTVSQGVQSRVFQTDSLGRTVLVKEPEWKNTATTYTYAYNTTGLSIVRSRPKANQSSSTVLTTTTTQLDALGRVVTVTYSDGTPNKTFVYDAACCWSQGSSATNLKGRLAVMGAGATTTHTGALFSYDIMGRVLDMWQCAPSTCPTSAAQISRPLYFTYDWLGDIVTEQDNIAGKVQYGYSSDREVTSITNLTFTGAKYAPNLVSSVQNGPNGPVSWSLGNGLTGVSMYDVPNQALHDGGWVCKTSTQTYCTGGTQLYGWVADSATQNLPLSYDNVNGNYTYGYDEFNRLTSASINSGQTAYTYTYDRWGNRTAQTLTAGSGYSWTGLANSYNQVTGWGYDAAGNLTTDGSNNSYSYDAEGNLLTLNNGVSGLLTFVYDAWNRRVSVATTSSTNEFVYDPQGHRMSTWNAANNVGTDGRIYWGDQQIAFLSADASTYFDHQDWLGTERMRTNYQGTAAASYTSLPFGDGSTQTVSTSGANQDNASFTSLELDPAGTYHAQFRQYGSTPGRFLSPDPSSPSSIDLLNPQSLNAYTYGQNNPVFNLDPSGLDCLHINNDTGGYAGFTPGDCDNSTEDLANSEYYVDGTVNNISVNQQGQVLGYSGNSDNGSPLSGSFMSAGNGAVYNLNPYTGTLSNSEFGQTVTVNGNAPGALDFQAGSLMSLINSEPKINIESMYMPQLVGPMRKLSPGEIAALCQMATALAAGGTVPGPVPASPTEDTPDEGMLIPSENARYPGETREMVTTPMTVGNSVGNNAANGAAMVGTFSNCVAAATAANR